MAPQESIPVAANVLGTIGTIFWCIQLVPQIWYNWRQKKTEGLPGLMMFLWAACAVPFGVYTVVQNFNIPVQIQPQIFCVLSLVSWTQILIYNNRWKTWKATLLGLGVGVVFGGLEALLILTLRGPYDRGVSWPMVLVGVIAAILLALGLLPPYFEIWKRRGRVIGINFVFLSMDWLGALFSLMALVAQHTFDVLGGILYILVMLLETGIFVSHVVWLFRTRKLRKQAKLAGQSFDDLPEAQPYQVQRSGTEKEREPSSTDIEKGNMHADDYPEVQASSHAQREGEDDKQISLKDHESGSFKTDNLRKAKAHPSVRVEDGEADRALSMDIGYEQVKVHNLPEVQAFLDRRRETRPSSNDIQKDDL